MGEGCRGNSYLEGKGAVQSSIPAYCRTKGRDERD